MEPLRRFAGVFEVDFLPGTDWVQFPELHLGRHTHKVGEREDSVEFPVKNDHQTKVFSFDLLTEGMKSAPAST